jgi:hypothetical protein
LLDARREIDRYQLENDEFQACLKGALERVEELGLAADDIAHAHDESISAEETLATQFNTALHNYKKRSTREVQNEPNN